MGGQIESTRRVFRQQSSRLKVEVKIEMPIATAIAKEAIDRPTEEFQVKYLATVISMKPNPNINFTHIGSSKRTQCSELQQDRYSKLLASDPTNDIAINK